MRSRRHPGPLTHVLVAGDITEVPAMQALLILLPERTYGQIYLELGPGDVVPELSRPVRVGLTAFVRDADDEPGSRLSPAVRCWAEEWAVDEHDESRDVGVWVGDSVRVAGVEGVLQRL